MENIYALASSSASTTYGNVMAVFKEIVVNNFTANYFTDINLTSEISYVNIRRRLGRNSLLEMSKLEKPFMTISPQIQPPNGDMFLYDIPLTKNIDNLECGITKNTLFPILKNTTDDYILNYKMNRDQIQFDITITVATLMEQLDLYKYMMNHFVWERPFTVNANLESMIPKQMIQYMGSLSNIDITKEDQIPYMISAMNRYSRYPITYKMRNGTSLDEYFLYYGVKLLINYTDLNIDQVNRKNMVDDFYQITFHATVDFNLPGMYALTGMTPRNKTLIAEMDVNTHGSHDLIPLFTINNLYARYAELKNGYMLYTSSRFQTERDSFGKDTLGIEVLFEKPYLDVINQYVALNIPMNTLVDIILLKDGVELEEEIDWKINWHKKEVTIINAEDSATYHILLYINNVLFNENITNNIEEVNTDKDI